MVLGGSSQLGGELWCFAGGLGRRELATRVIIADDHLVRQGIQALLEKTDDIKANLMSKLNVHDLAGLICVAIKHGPIFLNDWPFPATTHSQPQKWGLFLSTGRVIPHRQAA